MYQHECSESRIKKKKNEKQEKTTETAEAIAKAKDKRSVKQTVFWAGEYKYTPPSDSGYSDPAWLKQQTYHSGEQASDQGGLGGVF
jgi:hypothetical protein